MISACRVGRVASRTALLPAIAAVALAAPVSAAQGVTMNADHFGGMLHPSGTRPSFEVAAVRQSAPGAEIRFSGISMYPDRLEIRGTSLKDVIEFAYAVPDEKQFAGGPGWMRTERFDITAKPGEAEIASLGKLSPTKLHEQMRLRLQSLLEQRFALRVSFVAKEMPLYALVVARGGFKCRKVGPDSAAAFDGPIGPPPPPPAGGNGPMRAGHEPGGEQEMHWAAQAMPFPLIAAWISQQPELGGRVVVDKTGINGVFDCDISWAPDVPGVAGPGLFTALGEQMGLRLQPQKGPVETIVVDRIEQPSAN